MNLVQDIFEEIRQIENPTDTTTCGGSGKEFYKTHFVICSDCLVKMDKKAKGEA